MAGYYAVLAVLFLKLLYLDLLRAKLQFSCDSVAVQAGLSLALSETPKTGFVATGPFVKSTYVRYTVYISESSPSRDSRRGRREGRKY